MSHGKRMLSQWSPCLFYHTHTSVWLHHCKMLSAHIILPARMLERQKTNTTWQEIWNIYYIFKVLTTRVILWYYLILAPWTIAPAHKCVGGSLCLGLVAWVRVGSPWWLLAGARVPWPCQASAGGWYGPRGSSLFAHDLIWSSVVRCQRGTSGGAQIKNLWLWLLTLINQWFQQTTHHFTSFKMEKGPRSKTLLPPSSGDRGSFN